MTVLTEVGDLAAVVDSAGAVIVTVIVRVDIGGEIWAMRRPKKGEHLESSSRSSGVVWGGVVVARRHREICLLEAPNSYLWIFPVRKDCDMEVERVECTPARVLEQRLESIHPANNYPSTLTLEANALSV